jgi:hypothetical protein
MSNELLHRLPACSRSISPNTDAKPRTTRTAAAAAFLHAQVDASAHAVPAVHVYVVKVLLELVLFPAPRRHVNVGSTKAAAAEHRYPQAAGFRGLR